MAQCKECTYEIPAGSPVCTTCGAPAPAEAPMAASEKATRGVDEWLMRGVLGFLALIVAAAAAFTAWSMYAQMSSGR